MSHSSNMAKHARRGAKQARSAAQHVRTVAKHEGNGLLHTTQRVGNEAVSAVKEGYEGLRDTAAEYLDEGRERVQTLERLRSPPGSPAANDQRPIGSRLRLLGWNHFRPPINRPLDSFRQAPRKILDKNRGFFGGAGNRAGIN